MSVKYKECKAWPEVHQLEDGRWIIAFWAYPDIDENPGFCWYTLVKYAGHRGKVISASAQTLEELIPKGAYVYTRKRDALRRAEKLFSWARTL
jgi:hypothetical protein